MSLSKPAVFWRVHWSDLPAFSEENAWSRPWGQYNEEGVEPLRGYSAVDTAEDLVRYFDAHSGGLGDDLPVVAFWGVSVGVGPDNETLVVPTEDGVIAWMRGSDLDRGVLEHEDYDANGCPTAEFCAVLRAVGQKRRIK